MFVSLPGLQSFQGWDNRWEHQHRDCRAGAFGWRPGESSILMSAEGLLPSSYDYTYTFKPCFYTLSSICSDIVRLGSETETVSIATFFSDLSMDQNVKGFGLHFASSIIKYLLHMLDCTVHRTDHESFLILFACKKKILVIIFFIAECPCSLWDFSESS